MKFLVTTALCFFLLGTALAQTRNVVRLGVLSGVVTKYGTGEPIRNAEVTLTPAAGSATQLDNGEDASQQVTVVTDANGRFRFPPVPPVEYNLTLRKGGFHGFRGPNSHSWQQFLTVTVSPGESTSELALSMQPGAVVSGKVTDENGEPMANVQVSALKSIYVNHRRTLRPMGMATTDDNGNYRIHSLEPGRYLVRASVVGSSTTRMRYAPAYFPDATVPSDASVLSLRASDETAADFRMTRVRTTKVSGHVSNIGNPAQTQVYLRSTVDDGFSVARSGASVDKNGNFTLEGVLPGDYLLGAFEFQGDNNHPPLYATMPLKVDNSDLKDLSLTLDDAGKATLQGTLRIEGKNIGHPRLDSLRVGLLPAPDATSNEFWGEDGYSPVGVDGSIHFDRVSSGKYILSIVSDGPGWEDFYTKDVQIGNRDVTDGIINLNTSRGVVPVSVVVSTDGAYVEGTVEDENGKPAANATVIGIPDPALRAQYDLYQRAETDQSGHFRLRGIKPGSYSFYAWNSMEDQSYMDPEFMRGYEGYRVDLTLNPRDRQTLSLKLLSNGLE